MENSTNGLCMACADCCSPTDEIYLSKRDLEMICSLGFEVDEFSRVQEETGLRVLKNIDNQCVFLEGNGPYSCKIYPRHPTGCKIYPLIYDADRRKCVLDKKYCKHWKAFEHLLKDEEQCKRLIQFLRDELRLLK